ncbi:hypothetical protein CYMTET_38376 [Cymbomonas tetramitiformis]|uniref:Uncharacterized protein n=1 Tax=Cymbomonas tetramitiformis TaxID=36881 RepID=A0AAE0CEF1_9CHLO|nr:hypothetical protein CYMTET_38376 [Cymbomonas tetramitiformis]
MTSTTKSEDAEIPGMPANDHSHALYEMSIYQDARPTTGCYRITGRYASRSANMHDVDTPMQSDVHRRLRQIAQRRRAAGAAKRREERAGELASGPCVGPRIGFEVA